MGYPCGTSAAVTAGLGGCHLIKPCLLHTTPNPKLCTLGPASPAASVGLNWFVTILGGSLLQPPGSGREQGMSPMLTPLPWGQDGQEAPSLPGTVPPARQSLKLCKPNCKLFTPEEELGILVELAVTSPPHRSPWRRIGARKGPGLGMPRFPPGPAAAFLSPSPLCWSK